jgi:hypothetical protein
MFRAYRRPLFHIPIISELPVTREQSQGVSGRPYLRFADYTAKGTQMGFLPPSSRTMQLQRVIFATRHCPMR